VDGEEAIIGFTSFGPARDADVAGAASPNDAGELYAIYVSATRWRSGAGHALFHAACESMRERAYDSAVLWVLDDNPRARAFYERHGWAVDGLRRVVTAGAATGLVEVRYGVALAAR
ncbi:MAG TPA: GNAT family N-acetyltransferase, partial [Myxococcota bacterium]